MDKKFLFFLIFSAAACFGLASPDIYPYVITVFRWLLVIGGIICTLAAIECFFSALKNFRSFQNFGSFIRLLFRSGFKTSIVNFITLYRILICPVLLLLLFNESPAFKWLLLSAFITDAMDGYLARKFNVVTKLGSRLDSIADDCLFIVALIALFHSYRQFLTDNKYTIVLLLSIFFIRTVVLWFKHKKIVSALHTYATKAAAVVQAIFFLYCVFFHPSTFLFYIVILVTIIALIEETIIIYHQNPLRENYKGIFF